MVVGVSVESQPILLLRMWKPVDSAFIEQMYEKQRKAPWSGCLGTSAAVQTKPCIFAAARGKRAP